MRNGGRVYQVRGGSITSLTVQLATATSPGKAAFTGKATILDITDPLNAITLDTSATFQMSLTDYGDPTKDTLGIAVWNKSSALWFSSDWKGAKTAEQNLANGNLAVR